MTSRARLRVIAGRPVMPTERDYADKRWLRQGALGAPNVRAVPWLSWAIAAAVVLGFAAGVL